MKVHYEVYPPTLGQAMHRICRELKKWAPTHVQFVPAPQADVQIVDAVGRGFLHEAVRHERIVILQHCARTAGESEWWLPHWRKALLVVSYHDLYNFAKASDFPFLRVPWGVDGETFYNYRDHRDLAVLTFGYDDGQEAIRECHTAASLVGQVGVHVNARFPWMDEIPVQRVDNISDARLRDLYNRCRYVSGLRRIEGFELPVLEGLACGARPIVFDTPNTRHWFGNHAMFVPEVEPEALMRSLRVILSEDPPPISEEERKAVLTNFGWDIVARTIWRGIEEATWITA